MTAVGTAGSPLPVGGPLAGVYRRASRGLAVTNDERTVWRCIWRQVAAKNAAVNELHLRHDLRDCGFTDPAADTAIDELHRQGHIVRGIEEWTFEIEDSGWHLMAKALAGAGDKVPSNVVPFARRGGTQF